MRLHSLQLSFSTEFQTNPPAALFRICSALLMNHHRPRLSLYLSNSLSPASLSRFLSFHLIQLDYTFIWLYTILNFLNN